MMRRIAEVMGENQRLVGAMIGIAILKLYLETARAGLEAGLWKEPQLAAIQAQIRPINLLAGFGGSLRRERAASLWLLERPRAELEKVFNLPPPARGLDWGAALIRLGLKLCPRGWICQNQASLARSEQVMLDSFDPASRRIHAMQWTAGGTASEARDDGFTPYGFLARMAMPNFIRSLQALARVQTQLDQLDVACALERHRVAQGSYPGELGLLAPVYLGRIPGDIFADRPLQYRRDDQDGYLLWSVGWNEKSDGGEASLGSDGRPAYGETSGDWVWLLKHPWPPAVERRSRP